jgi:hypothetical protein
MMASGAGFAAVTRQSPYCTATAAGASMSRRTRSPRQPTTTGGGGGGGGGGGVVKRRTTTTASLAQGTSGHLHQTTATPQLQKSMKQQQQRGRGRGWERGCSRMARGVCWASAGSSDPAPGDWDGSFDSMDEVGAVPHVDSP